MRGNDRRTALVTGGSRGLGLALARELARRGHDLVLVARSQANLDQAAASVASETGCRVSTYAVDLTPDQGPQALFDRVQAAGIEIHLLVNNAGVGEYGTFALSDLDRQYAMLRLNIMSLTALTRLFLPSMLERRSGHILNVASLVAYFAGGPLWASYVASKHYVLAFTRGLAAELSGSGVSATALCPGPMVTDFADGAGVSATRAYRWLPKVSVARVARSGVRAALRGRTTVVPGVVNRINAALGELPPRAVAQGVFAFLSQRA